LSRLRAREQAGTSRFHTDCDDPDFCYNFSIVREILEIEIDSIDGTIAKRLATLRSDRGWTLEELAAKTGFSRATLSRIERCELSPTAAMLNKLCAQYGWTASRLMAEAESGPPAVVRAAEQVTRKDPESHYIRRVISPPHPNLKGEMVEVSLPAGSSVEYDVSPLPGLEHHLWVLDGVLSIEIEGTAFRLEKGDCVRYVLSGASSFSAGSKRSARYVVAMVHP
jgi:transcriptional regulator with XRE-family HTH domain